MQIRFALASLALLACTTAGAAGAGAQDFVGIATDPDSGAFLYREINRFEFEDGEIVGARVTYEDADGQLFAERLLDFRISPYVPEFHTRMFTTGFEERIRRVDGQLELGYRKAGGKKMRTRLIEEPPEAAADDGLVPYVMHKLDALLAGEKVVFRFLAPSYRGKLNFTAYHDGDVQLDGRRTHVIRIDIGGFLIQLFADPIFLSFDAEKRSFVEYRGLSNLRDPDGDTWPVAIRYPVEGLQLDGDAVH